MHIIMQMLWRRRGNILLKEWETMMDLYFIGFMVSSWPTFNATHDKLNFYLGTNIKNFVTEKNMGKI